MNLKKAIQAIEKRGVLLVFPINNAKEPPSLWSEFYPRSQMRWEWDADGDNRVAELWHLREELSRSKKVVYSKWYKGRATFFSREVFPGFLNLLHRPEVLSIGARSVLELLLEESPLSTKALKKRAKLQGRLEEGNYNRILKELWSQLLLVGVGEVDDGAFPSLNIGATEVLFEELYRESLNLRPEAAWKRLECLKPESPFLKDLKRVRRAVTLVKRPKKGEKRIIKGSDLFIDTKS